MPNTQLVKNVGVCRSEIGHSVVAQHEALKHRFVNDPACAFFVRADRFEAGILDGWFDHLRINAVKIDHPAILVVFFAEWHENEAV